MSYALVGYPGKLRSWVVERRARSLLGREWRLFENCEHVVSWAHGLEPESPQLRGGIAAVVLVGSIIGGGGWAIWKSSEI